MKNKHFEMIFIHPISFSVSWSFDIVPS